jgi:Tfp pilus assembly protein PilN
MVSVVRINLLPHREQKRAARQRQFISLASRSAILGLAVVGLGARLPGVRRSSTRRAATRC